MTAEETRTWTLNALQTLFMASTDETWTEAFTAAFAPGVSIRAAALGEGMVEPAEHELANVVPGDGQRSEEQAGDDARVLLEHRIKATKMAHRSRVEWGSVTATSENDGRVIVQGVGTITRSMVFRLRAAPAQLKFDVYFRAEIASPSTPKITRYAQTARLQAAYHPAAPSSPAPAEETGALRNSCRRLFWAIPPDSGAWICPLGLIRSTTPGEIPSARRISVPGRSVPAF